MSESNNLIDWGEVVTGFEGRIPMPEYVFLSKLLNELERIADALENLTREGKRERA